DSARARFLIWIARCLRVRSRTFSPRHSALVSFRNQFVKFLFQIETVKQLLTFNVGSTPSYGDICHETDVVKPSLHTSVTVTKEICAILKGRISREKLMVIQSVPRTSGFDETIFIRARRSAAALRVELRVEDERRHAENSVCVVRVGDLHLH